MSRICIDENMPLLSLDSLAGVVTRRIDAGPPFFGAFHEAMEALTRIFSDLKLAAKAHFRCSVDGPTEMDRLFESIMDETFGLHARSEYKRWVSRLYRLGLIPEVPGDWVDPHG
jgi:hypothetical protein